MPIENSIEEYPKFLEPSSEYLDALSNEIWEILKDERFVDAEKFPAGFDLYRWTLLVNSYVIAGYQVSRDYVSARGEEVVRLMRIQRERFYGGPYPLDPPSYEFPFYIQAPIPKTEKDEEAEEAWLERIFEKLKARLMKVICGYSTGFKEH